MKAYIVRIVKDPPKDYILEGYGYYRIIAMTAESAEMSTREMCSECKYKWLASEVDE